jgi:predicted aconitase
MRKQRQIANVERALAVDQSLKCVPYVDRRDPTPREKQQLRRRKQAARAAARAGKSV